MTARQNQDHGRIPVLFIGGWGRSGSTILERLLGQVPGVIPTGELREIWQRGLVENRPCGCGMAFRQCPFWSNVGEEAFGGWDRVDLQRVVGARMTLDRPWSYPMLRFRRAPERAPASLRMYRTDLEAIYRAVARISNGSLIVDSSKIPTHAQILAGIGSLDVRIVHLVRDSRGVAFSWTKRVEKRVGDQEPYYLPTYGPLGSAVRWTAYNAMTGSLRATGQPYAFLKYEDLISDPVRHVRRILRFSGLADEPGELAFLRDGQADLRPNHTVDGNPVRWTQGPVHLRQDDEWRRSMTRSDRGLVTIITGPLLASYRYPLSTLSGS